MSKSTGFANGDVYMITSSDLESTPAVKSADASGKACGWGPLALVSADCLAAGVVAAAIGFRLPVSGSDGASSSD